jgi:hypothetical protein
MPRKLITALIVGGLAAAWFREWREMRHVQQRARDLLYPGDPEEIAEVLVELQRHSDDESKALAKQLEERLKIKDHRAWRRVSRRRLNGSRAQHGDSASPSFPKGDKPRRRTS